MSQQINLYSPLFRKQKKLFTALAMAQALGIVIIALVALYGYARVQVTELAGQARDSDTQVQTGLERVKKIPAVAPVDEKQLDARIIELEAKAQTTEQAAGTTTGLRGHQGYAEALRALARQRLEGVWLTSITLAGESGDLSLVGKALRADLVPQYIDRLTKDPAMQGRQFSTLAIERQAPAKPVAGSETGSASDAVVFRLMAAAAAEK